MLKRYIRDIYNILGHGDAREESYYSALEGFLKEYAKSTGKGKIYITTLPKKTEAGNPDFRIWDGKQHIVGYIEAKSPTIEDLERIERTEQLRRYRHIFPNLILTNFIEFRLYRNGALVDKVNIVKPPIAYKLKTTLPIEKEQDFIKLLEKFFSFSLPRVYDAKTLAIELAKRTRFLKDEVISQELINEERVGKGFIFGFYTAFKEYLIRGLSKEDFADLYSQTITYGLFAARTRSGNSFNRKLAYDNIPRTIGILRDVFRFISLEDLPEQMECIIDDISEVLAVTDVRNILHKYFHEGKGKDPVVHFYETFLAEYDPQTRKKRGVYYTPEAVVSYIVRSLHSILKEHSNRPYGFADNTVTVLDPAAGTLTFLVEAAKLAVEEFISKYGEGGKENFIKDHILKSFYAFELMMAPYAVGHLKVSFLLEELGYRLQRDDRFKLYLTNTLEMEELAQTELPGMASLSEESHLAGKVKKEIPILVILGNPPYSGISANPSEKEVTINKGERYTAHYQLQKDEVNSSYKLVPQTKSAKRKIRIKQKTWIGELIEHYKIVDGHWLKERNPKWLQDDYVKFIRFAQWKIEQLGEGIIGFITNHSYLDNPTFRGMRQSLMNSFDQIYVLDLHGNILRKEKCPDGSKDENVFDIQQGVAISLFIKRKGEKKECKVYYSGIWGLRKKKGDWLLKNDVKTVRWQTLLPKSEFYFFVPRERKFLEAYEKYLKMTDIFSLNNVGIITARDNLTVKWTPEEVWQTVLNFSKLDSNSARTTYNLGKDARDWKVQLAQKDLIDSGLDKKRIVPILYRPFDIRYTYYTGKSRGFHCMPRPEVMRHMMRENLGLLTCRQQNKVGFYHAWVCKNIVESCVVSNKTREINYLFPLFLYPDTAERDLFSLAKKQEERQPNINPKLLFTLSEVYKKELSPEEIFYYVYAVLYSNTYRSKYAEFLKTDFPRIPFTRDYKQFSKMTGYGKRIIELHLLKSKELDPSVAKFQGKSNSKVEKLRYDEKERRVYINQNRYFEGIVKEVWQYQIGGYQVCGKWLKDKKKRKSSLSLNEIKDYCKIVTAIQKTIKLQKAIDDIFLKAEKEVVEFKK